MKYRLLSLLLLVLASCSAPRSKSGGKPATTNSETGRYNNQLGITLPAGIDKSYISEISKWTGTPYKYGGTTTNGTDCSGLVQTVYRKVFNLEVDHNSLALYKKAKPVNKSKVIEGDLVFFKINGDKISHVGMHITGDYFIHASTKKGVIVSSITDEYYRKTFAGYGTYRSQTANQ